jgi:hypothetical protein
MPDWALVTIGAVGGAVTALSLAYVGLVWYLNRDNHL